MLEASRFPIFLRATMPQVQSPGTGEGSGCGRFRVYLPTRFAVLESKTDMQKRGQASPDDGDALALTFARPVAPAEVEEPDEEEEFGVQDHFKFAMGDRLQAQDAFDIDDSRTMDAHKTNGIEPLGKLVQRGPVQQLLSSDVQVRINAGSFDPVDIGHPYEAG